MNINPELSNLLDEYRDLERIKDSEALLVRVAIEDIFSEIGYRLDCAESVIKSAEKRVKCPHTWSVGCEGCPDYQLCYFLKNYQEKFGDDSR